MDKKGIILTRTYTAMCQGSNRDKYNFVFKAKDLGNLKYNRNNWTLSTENVNYVGSTRKFTPQD